MNINLQPLGYIKQLGEAGSFTGYASVFHHRDAQGDSVISGAFRESLLHWRRLKRLPPLLWQHDTNSPIGAFKNIYEDNYGLWVEGQLALEIGRAREAHALLKIKAIDGLSIGYNPITSTPIIGGGKRLEHIALHEISLVTIPANDAARISSVKASLATLHEKR